MRPPNDTSLVTREFLAQLSQLGELDLTHRTPGADLTAAALEIIRNDRLREWLLESNRLVEELRGSQRLRRRRRRGVLRNPSAPDVGLPFFKPPLQMYTTVDSPSPIVVPLLDELEWIVIPGRIERGEFLPLKRELTFDEARAIVGMRASVLYELTSRRLVAGQIFRPRGGDPDANGHELRFDAREFMRWSSVVPASHESRRR